MSLENRNENAWLDSWLHTDIEWYMHAELGKTEQKRIMYRVGKEETKKIC